MADFAATLFHSEPEDSTNTIGTEIYSDARRISAPAPNPHFSFPMLPSEETEHSGFERGSHSRHHSRSRPQDITTSPLPPLSFTPNTPHLSPPPNDLPDSSPSRNSMSRGHGHKRGGSELIGGDGPKGGSGLLCTSPTKAEGLLPSPPTTAGRRRGHAHRRSGAISSHDLSFMLSPKPDTTPSRAGSLPTSPLCPPVSAPPTFGDRPASRASTIQSIEPISDSIQSSPKRNSTGPRPRVGFSDTLEFIPRPLSTISSETSSSLSTIRASHSVTGSISSIISVGTPSPPSTKKIQHAGDPIRDLRLGDGRPKTADPLNMSAALTSSFRPSSPPMPRPSSAGAGKVLRMAYRQDLVKSVCNKDSDATLKASHRAEGDKKQSSSVLPRLSSSQLSRPRSSPDIKSSRQRKVRSWADSLLSRKSKSKESFNTPARQSIEEPRQMVPMEVSALDEVNFDEDNTLVIRSPTFVPATSATDSKFERRSFDNHKPSSTDNEGVLDLDAVWSSADAESDSQSGAAGQVRRLHSSGVTGGFFGPGMHYHRRAESAPVLSSLSPAFALRKFGSNQQMADVFEEDEEEDDQLRRSPASANIGAASDNGQSSDNLRVAPNDQHPASISASVNSPATSQYAPSVNDKSVATESSRSRSSSDVPVHIVDSENEYEPRLSNASKSVEDNGVPSSFTNPFHPNPIITTMTSTADFAQRGYRNAPDSTATSPHTSPDPGHYSFDGPRLRTTASSITERSTWSSLRPGDNASSLCYSSEDVPSLTSSASTMISGHPSQFSPNFATSGHDERSYSVSESGPNRSRPTSAGKRSSLASLSRLVGASHSEKSKLSLASFTTDYTEKGEHGKRHRISKIMRFWKSKDKAHASSEDLRNA